MEFSFDGEDCVWRKALAACLDVTKAGATLSDAKDASSTSPAVKVGGANLSGLGSVFRLALTSNEGANVTSKHLYPIRSNFGKSQVDSWIDVVSGVKDALW